jgi:hypothetical protein
MNCRKRSLAFVSILQRLSAAEIAMRYICEIFAAPRFSSFSTQSANRGHPGRGTMDRPIDLSQDRNRKAGPAYIRKGRITS